MVPRRDSHRQNLRATLTRLRRIVESDDPAGRTSRLRTVGELISLARLAIASQLQLGDWEGLRARVQLLNEMLDDFAVEPEPATAMLLSRADEQLRRIPTATAVT